MSARHTPPDRPSPGPLCAAFAPLLPLLSTGALTGEEERAVREHLASCAWCRHELATYAVVEEAVREYQGIDQGIDQGADPTSRQYSGQPSSAAGLPFAQAFAAGARHLTLEDIMKASEQSRAANDDAARRGARNNGWSGSDTNPRPRGKRSVLATVGAVAATLLVVILAASLFARLSQRTPTTGSSPATARATTPAAPACNSNFANSPIHGAQTSVEGVPLPPVTYVVPDNAANLHGYDLCSSGTSASVSAFLTSSLPSSGWTKGSDPRCFYSDECWTKGSSVISWQVTDPTLWHIAYHPTAG